MRSGFKIYKDEDSKSTFAQEDGRPMEIIFDGAVQLMAMFSAIIIVFAF